MGSVEALRDPDVGYCQNTHRCLPSLRTGIEGKIGGVRREWETEGIGEERKEGEKEKYNVI